MQTNPPTSASSKDRLDPIERPTCTIDEVASILGVSRTSAYDAAHSGQIPSIRVGRRLLVPTAALRRLLSIDVDTAQVAS